MSDGPGGKTCCRGDTFQSLWHRLRSPARFWRIRTFGRDSSGWHGRGLPSPATWSGFTGSSAPSIHWFFNGAILPGNSNNNSLILTWVGFTNAGAYSVTLSNDSGSVTSQPAWLSVLPTNVVSFGDRELQFGQPSGPIWEAPRIDDAGQSITGDGLTLYYESSMPGGSGDVDVWMISRPTLTSPWSAPVNLGTNVNSPYHDGGPVLSPDRLSLYFDSTRPGGQGAHDIWVASRSTVNAPFGKATNLGPAINSSSDDGGAQLSADNLTMVFTSSRLGSLGYLDVWMSTRTNAQVPWEPARHLPAPINFSSAHNFPVALSRDGLTMFFKSDRPIQQGTNIAALFVTRRPTPGQPFGPPILVQPILGLGDGGVDFSSLSDDGKTLWVGTYRTLYPDWPEMFQISITELPQLIPLGTAPSGNFQLSLLGREGATYEVDASADLATWTNLLTTNFTGTISLSDPKSNLQPHRFYRARSH